MTIVTKRIGDAEYLYYQDAVAKADGGYATVSNYIGRTDFDAARLAEGMAGALSVHLEKIVDIAKITSPFRFSVRPTAPFNDIVLLEKLRFVYEYIARNVPGPEAEQVERSLFVAYVHGTTAIEGNTLSEGETEKLLYADLTPANKSRNEILEVSNYADAQEYIDRYSRDIDLAFIKRIHAMLMVGIKDKDGRLISAGKFRKERARIAGANFSPSDPEHIEKHLQSLVAEYQSKKNHMIHPIELATTFHHGFEKIHPFTDGNGRTGRAVLNFMLTKGGFPRIYILPEQRRNYLRTLQEADYGNPAPLIDFLIQRILATLSYFYAKTSAYGSLSLPQTQKLFVSLYGEKVSENILMRLDRTRESASFP